MKTKINKTNNFSQNFKTAYNLLHPKIEGVRYLHDFTLGSLKDTLGRKTDISISFLYKLGRKTDISINFCI